MFLPANATSILQLLDIDIIKNFKVYYCTRLLRFVVSKIETSTTVSEVATSIHAIR